MVLGWIYITLAVLVIVALLLVILFAFRLPPFNGPYQFRDPRTWKTPPSPTSWLTPIYDYGPYQRDIPDDYQSTTGTETVQQVYCKFDPSRCQTSNAGYAASNPPTGIC